MAGSHHKLPAGGPGHPRHNVRMAPQLGHDLPGRHVEYPGRVIEGGIGKEAALGVPGDAEDLDVLPLRPFVCKDCLLLLANEVVDE
eukprot:350628_1